VTDLTAEDQLARAHDLAISAFMGETIYNFGELVSKQKEPVCVA
jgi:26S proteasome regulatory subunit N9